MNGAEGIWSKWSEIVDVTVDRNLVQVVVGHNRVLIVSKSLVQVVVNVEVTVGLSLVQVVVNVEHIRVLIVSGC